ncbi:MAG: MATE family efflux transporter, partial [Oscillospiraceae bacterium]|nr:MATE family efflux transporter [Oscillospiraceae bacterium]
MASKNVITTESKKVVTTLDSLPFGTDEQLQNMTQKFSKELPAGISSRMLYRDILVIAWPAMAERAFAAFASMISMIMVGSLGPWAIASVGLAMMPRMLMVTIVMALNVGATALIARSRGAGDRVGANAYLKQAMILGVACSIVVGALGFIFAQPLIRLMGATEEASLIGGTVFQQIQSLGFIFIGIPITITAALRGIGDSRSPMIYNTVATVVTIFLSFLLIEGRWGFPRLEVAGASIAAVLGQVVATVMALYIIRKKENYISLNFKMPMRINWRQLKDILEIGLPAMGEQIILRTGMILVNRIVASLGTNDFAAHHIGMNFMIFTMINGEGISTSATTLMGQSIGKKRPDMAQAYTSRCRKTGLIAAFILAAFVVLLRHPLTRLYTDDHEVIQTSVYIILILALNQPFQASQFIVSGALRGAGDTFAVAVVNFASALVLRPVLAAIAIFVLDLGAVGAWYAFLADQIMRSFLIMLRFNSGKWKRVFFTRPQ